MTTCDPLYFNTVNIIRRVTRVVKVAIHCIYDVIQHNSIATLSKQLIFNQYATSQLQPCYHVDITNFHPSIKI